MDPRIAEASREVDEARERLRAVAAAVQESCKHESVLLSKGRSSWFNHPTIRVCANCGLEEQGGVYDHDHRNFVQLRSEFVKEVADIHRHRVPNCGSDIRHVQYGRYIKENER